ncbi:MAG TPA: hypothetical protein VGI25_04805 [Candidatus Udaeobacter sp.]
MKPLSILLVIACLVLSSCADPLEQRTTEEVEGQLQRGVTGQGTIGPLERSPGDPTAEHSVPGTHP